MRWLLYLLILLILFYLFLWWSIRKAPVMKDDERDVRRISRLLERLNGSGAEIKNKQKLCEISGDKKQRYKKVKAKDNQIIIHFSSVPLF